MRVGIDGSCWSNRRGYGRFTRALVTEPNQPPKGLFRWKLTARCESTRPDAAGTTAPSSARRADTQAIGSASRVTQPHQ